MLREKSLVCFDVQFGVGKHLIMNDACEQGVVTTPCCEGQKRVFHGSTD